MEMLTRLFERCSSAVRLALIKADLIPQLMLTLNPQSLSLVGADTIHTFLIFSISSLFWLPTPHIPEIEDRNEQQAVHKTILTQVLVPSEKYIWHLCVSRYSIIYGNLSDDFMRFLARLIRICPCYQPTMDFILNMPVVLTIPGYLTFIDNNRSIWNFVDLMGNIQHEWNKKGGDERTMGNTMLRMLRMEGISDVVEEKLRNETLSHHGSKTVTRSIDWNNMQGMNLPRRR
ncbi:hypothetical protein BLNAU_11740 [Blattamonas nauphoetae]|uniref:Uncharacterized protein n=1 Tax=Blattamonas nauphoetae TaxID=2049346 RepID=A0ABQ9XRB5_9EUKA|nr:hypothetical protein BLNAU_11740 [Blattamonas nauphoetae]